jgi:hypothetical protein
VLIAAAQDVPYCVIGTILLNRTVNDRKLMPEQNFLLLLLILMSSVATMVYKAMHVKDLPGLWAARTRLIAERTLLMQREAALTLQAASGSSRAVESDDDHDCEAIMSVSAPSLPCAIAMQVNVEHCT